MAEFFRYIFIASASLGICYMGFLLFRRKEQRFNHQRYFLLLSILISVALPFSKYGIPINIDLQQEALMMPKEPEIQETTEMVPLLTETSEENGSMRSTWPVEKILILIYFAGVITVGIRILAHLLLIFFHLINSEKEIIHGISVRISDNISAPFTFFKWIFIPKQERNKDEVHKIILHEKIHASQYHSIDIMLIEALSAVMWFNPFIWMMRKSVQLVHEYLADEGVLNTGFDRLRYQALLLNQVAEERLICLSSGFNHSIIKKRMIMMTKSKFNQKTKLHILALLPLSAILFFGVACVNGQNKSNVVTAVEPVRMNVLYVGVSNPVKIAASGYEASDLMASVDNGSISGKNGEYVIRPKTPGSAIVTVSSNKKEIQKTTFRVKVVPDPIATIKSDDGLKTNGTITKKELLDAGNITVVMKNFDFDLNFEVVSFVMSATVPGKFIIREEITEGNSYSPLQKDLIKSLVPNQKIMIEEIYVAGPDGAKRKLNPMVFSITE